MGMQDIAGVGDFIELGGRRLQIFPLRPEDFAEAKVFLRKETENPFEAAKRMVADLPIEVQKEILKDAYKEYLAWGNLHTPAGRAWAASVEGVSFFVWRSLREKNPDLAGDDGRKWVFNALQELASEEMIRLMDSVQEATNLEERDPTFPAKGRSRRKTPSKQRGKAKKNGTASTGRSPRSTRGAPPRRSLDLRSPKFESSLETRTIGSPESRK